MKKKDFLQGRYFHSNILELIIFPNPSQRFYPSFLPNFVMLNLNIIKNEEINLFTHLIFFPFFWKIFRSK